MNDDYEFWLEGMGGISTQEGISDDHTALIEGGGESISGEWC